MTEIKTKPYARDVDEFLSSLEGDQWAQSNILIEMMKKISGKEPIMWGTSIVGFDPFHYKSASGSEGDWPRIGFSPRKGKISLYLTMDASQYLPEVEKLGGKNSIGKGCIYLQKFDQVDEEKLYALIEQAYKDSRKEVA